MKDKDETNPEGFSSLFIVSVFNPSPGSAARCGRHRVNSGTIHWESTRDPTKLKMDESSGGDTTMRQGAEKKKKKKKTYLSDSREIYVRMLTLKK